MVGPALLVAVWVAAAVVLCGLRVDATFAALLAFGVVAVSCVLLIFIGRDLLPGRRSTLLLVASFFVLSFFVIRTFYWITWDPIGTEDDGWGFVPGPFQDAVRESQDSRIGNGLLTSVRRTSSGLLSVDFPAAYFVFVHRPGQVDSRGNLVFRYFATDSGFDSPPELTWQAPNRILVKVEAGNVLTVTKERQSVDGAQIRYDIRTMKRPAELSFWQRPFF